MKKPIADLKRISVFVSVLALLFFAGCAGFKGKETPAPSPEGAASGETPLLLKKIKHNSKSDSSEVEIEANRKFSYTAYNLTQPNRLAIEIPDMQSELDKSLYTFSGPLVESVDVVRFPKVNSLRVEILLKTKAEYSIQQVENKMTVRLTPDASIVAAGSEGTFVQKDSVAQKMELEEQVQNKETTIEEMRTKMDQMSAQMNSLEDRNRSMAEKNQALVEKVKSLNSDILRLNSQIKEKEFEMSKSDSLNRALSDKIREIEKGRGQAAVSKDQTASPDPEAEKQRKMREEEEIRVEVKNRILAWRGAWTSKNIDEYMGFYSKSFRSENMGWEDWKKDKETKFQKIRVLQVELGEIQAEVRDGEVEARFEQIFRSDRHRDRGFKTLGLIREGKEWKITHESWTPKKGS